MAKQKRRAVRAEALEVACEHYGEVFVVAIEYRGERYRRTGRGKRFCSTNCRVKAAYHRTRR